MLYGCKTPNFKRPIIPECRALDAGTSFCIDQNGEKFERSHFGNREVSPDEEAQLVEYTKGLEKCLSICLSRECEKRECSGVLE